jgi:DUF4097 and DUF4098 domain-containing protein YvlB
MKKVLVPLVVLGSCLLFGLVLFAGCIVSRHASGLLTDWGPSEKAVRTEARQAPLAEGGRVELDLSHGDVEIDAGSADQLELAAEITAYGADEAEARAELERTRLVIEEQSDGVRLRIERDAAPARSRLAQTHRPKADLKLRLPRGVRFEARTGSGSIRARGPIGSSHLESGYGDVRVAEAQGDLELESGSGSIELARLSDAARLSARSGYGSVVARNVDAREIELASSSGNVRLQDARGEHVKVTSGYGNLEIARVQGELTAKTSSGHVRASALDGAKLALASSYGDLEISGARGALDASSSSGSLSIDGLEGSCRARSGYGNVAVEGRVTGLHLESSSGSVRASVAEGSSLEGITKLSSGYGHVELVVPRALGFELQASTGYGTLEVQVPVTVEAGGLKHTRSVRGRVGAGGPTIELKTSSGNVRVTPGS